MADVYENEDFIVEDGSGFTNASSYTSVAFADKYLTLIGKTGWVDLPEEEKKAKLVVATSYIDNLYPWKGRRKYSNQSLKFPRVEVIDIDGFEVSGIPENLKKAVCEAAYISISTSSLFTTRDENGQVKRQAVENAVEVEYFQSSTESESAYYSIYGVLDSLLKGLYRKKGQAAPVVRRVKRCCW